MSVWGTPDFPPDREDLKFLSLIRQEYWKTVILRLSKNPSLMIAKLFEWWQLCFFKKTETGPPDDPWRLWITLPEQNPGVPYPFLTCHNFDFFYTPNFHSKFEHDLNITLLQLQWKKILSLAHIIRPQSSMHIREMVINCCHGGINTSDLAQKDSAGTTIFEVLWFWRLAIAYFLGMFRYLKFFWTEVLTCIKILMEVDLKGNLAAGLLHNTISMFKS